jgi:hypothetical protein
MSKSAQVMGVRSPRVRLCKDCGEVLYKYDGTHFWKELRHWKRKEKGETTNGQVHVPVQRLPG